MTEIDKCDHIYLCTLCLSVPKQSAREVNKHATEWNGYGAGHTDNSNRGLTQFILILIMINCDINKINHDKKYLTGLIQMKLYKKLET